MPLISVITVCYQAEAYLEQCILSVLSQEFDGFEYILIDGGSSDRTVEIIKKYRDRLAYWHSKPDRGLAHAFNMGLQKSRGKWVAFLNSDDFYSAPNVLSEAAETLASADEIDVMHGIIRHIAREHDVTSPSDEIGGPWDWRKFRRCSTIPHPAAFVSRRLIDEIGFFDENFRNALDYEFFLRKGPELRVSFVPSLFAYMRTGGISTNEAERSLRESRDSQIKNKASSAFGAYLWWANFRLRLFIKRLSGLSR